MNQQKAKERLNELVSANNPSIDEILEGFRLSLAVGDHLKAMQYQEHYQNLIYDLFLEISLNIDQKEYYEKFMTYQDAWIKLIDLGLKPIYVAIMSHKDIYNKDELFAVIDQSLLLGSQLSVEKAKESIKDMTTIEELRQHLFSKIQQHEETNKLNALCYIAERLDDVELANQLLDSDEIEEWRKDHLRLNNASVIARTDLNQALEYLSDLDKKYIDDISEIKLQAAKILAKTDLGAAEEIMRSICSNRKQYAFRAYVAALNDDKSKVKKIIEEVEIFDKQNGMDPSEYDYTMMEIAFEIASFYPETAQELLTKLHENWFDRVSVQIEIAVAKSLKDIGNVSQNIAEIDEEYYRADAIYDLLESFKDPEVIKSLVSIASTFEPIGMRYRVVYQISKRTGVDLFEKLEELSKQLYPYQMSFDDEARLEYYTNKELRR